MKPETQYAEIVISPRRHSRVLKELAETWRYRQLLWVLVRRDLTVRYKETLLGATWALLQPLALMLVFWLALGRVLKFAAGDVPYPLFVLAGLLPWTFFATAVASSTNSLVGATHLIQKVYFPRLIIPLSTLGIALVDFAVGLVVLFAFAGWSGRLGLSTFAIIAPLSLIALASLAVGTLCSALAAAYRDTRYMIPLLLQLWMFATPVFYPADVLAPEMRWVLDLNPMAPLIEAFRNIVLTREVAWLACIRSGGIFGLLLWFSAWFFMSVERRIVDTL